jgi:hypothetical protein
MQKRPTLADGAFLLGSAESCFLNGKCLDRFNLILVR